jgi:nucleoside-diphosphate-sugar epimerase
MAVTGIFITGISGFLGKNLVRYFQSVENVKLFGHGRNYDQVSTQFKNSNVSIVPQYSAEVFNSLGIDCVIHLAGIAHDLSARYKEQDYFQVNDLSTRLVYDEFVKSKAGKFIFLSSIKASADIGQVPVIETAACHPVTAYGRSKHQAEVYIESQFLPPGKKYYVFRPCMIHGPGNKGNLNLLYKYANAPLPFPLGAFHNQRSFLNVDNFNFIVDQFMKGNIESGIYHLADEGFLSTTELYGVIAQTLGKKPRIWNIPASLIRFIFSLIAKRKMLDKLTEDMMVSNKKVLKAIGKPLPVGLHDGLARTIKSFRES